MCDMQNTLDWMNSRLDIIDENTIELKDIKVRKKE